jgi:hypothetical protein
MIFWAWFWGISLLVAGTSFVFITVVVAVKGQRDLRQWFSSLKRQKEEQ